MHRSGSTSSLTGSGAVQISTGAATAGRAGDVILGVGKSALAGGDVLLSAGSSIGQSSNAGKVRFAAGHAKTGIGGTVEVCGGDSMEGSGGVILFRSGQSVTGGSEEPWTLIGQRHRERRAA